MNHQLLYDIENLNLTLTNFELLDKKLECLNLISNELEYLEYIDNFHYINKYDYLDLAIDKSKYKYIEFEIDIDDIKFEVDHDREIGETLILLIGKF